MKGLLLTGLLLAAPVYGFSHQGTNWTVDQTQATNGFDFSSIEQQILQDLQNLESLFGDPNATPQSVDQQMNQIAQEVNQLNQQMIAETMSHRLGIHRLPRQNIGKPSASVTVGTIQIAAGDRRVSEATLKQAQQYIQQVSLPILQTNLNKQPAKGTQVVLFSSQQTYANALLRAGVSQQELPSIVSNTGGLTIGSNVWIPLYNLQTRSDLANVLTHELTHVVLNQEGIGDNLPTWINEGTAWHDGLTAQGQVDPNVTQQLEGGLNNQIQTAAQNGQLLPLSASESDILSANYNVEWVDYLAVDKLIQTYGQAKYTAFLEGIPSLGVDASFKKQFDQSRSAFENSFLQSLQSL